jgi:hypothetical protein
MDEVTPFIEANDLRRSFKTIKAVAGVSFSYNAEKFSGYSDQTALAKQQPSTC